MYLFNVHINLKLNCQSALTLCALVKSVLPLNNKKKKCFSAFINVLDVNSLHVGRCQKCFIILRKNNNQTYLIIYNYWVILIIMNIVTIIQQT